MGISAQHPWARDPHPHPFKGFVSPLQKGIHEEN